MKRIFGYGLGAAITMASDAMLSAMFDRPVLTPAQQYQFRPYTAKNIGKALRGNRSKYMPHQGEQEIARRQRQEHKRQDNVLRRFRAEFGNYQDVPLPETLAA